MTSRVPDGLMYNKGQAAINTSRSTMLKNQEQALTGKRINRPSEDPPGTIQVIQTKTIAERDEAVSSNLEVANAFLGLTDSSLGELTEVLSRAKELAIQMSSTTNSNEDSREAVSKEVKQLGLRALQIGNTRLGDKYIFAGYQMNRAPFDPEGNYYGDTGNFEVEMDRGQRMTINVPGVMPFFGVGEMPNEAQGTREDPTKNEQPSIPGHLRDPASITAGNQGVDPIENADEYKQLQEKSGINIFQSFKAFEEGLVTGKKELVQQAVDDFERGFKQVLSSRAMVGARQNILGLSLESLELNKVSNAELRSKAEDADTMKVFSDLTKNETVLNATLEINKKLLTPSLMDFLK